MRYTIDVLCDIAVLNARASTAKAERERVAFLLEHTALAIAASVRAGTPIEERDLRESRALAERKHNNDRDLREAMARDLTRRPPLLDELRTSIDDPASTYEAIVATLTERYGAPSAESYLSGKDRSGWEVETFSPEPPRWRSGRATFVVMVDGRGTLLYASAENYRFSRTEVPHMLVRASADMQRRIVSGESALTSVNSVEELGSSRRTAPVLTTLATALDVIEHCVRYSRNEACAFLDAQAIADDAEYRRRRNVTPA